MHLNVYVSIRKHISVNAASIPQFESYEPFARDRPHIVSALAPQTEHTY